MTTYDKALTVFAGAALVIAEQRLHTQVLDALINRCQKVARSKAEFANTATGKCQTLGLTATATDFQPSRVASPCVGGGFLMLKTQC